MEARKTLQTLKRAVSNRHGSRLRITGPHFSSQTQTWFLLLSSSSGMHLAFLPAFHVVLTDHSCSLMAYNGKELRREEGSMLMESQLIDMVAEDKLELCQGVQLLKHENFVELDTLRESVDDQVVVRNPQCQYFVRDGGGVCDACLDHGQVRPLIEGNGEINGSSEAEEGIKNEALEVDHVNDVDFESLHDNYDVDQKGQIEEPSYKDVGRSAGGPKRPTSRKRNSPQGGFSRTCPLCFTHFARERLYTRHMDVHKSRQSDLDEPIQCPLCGLQVENKYKINEHLTTVHSSNEGLCVLCLKLMPCTDLKKHYLHSHHHKCKHHLCPLCGESFTSSVNMKVHMSEVHNQGDLEKKVCDHCGKVFPHKTRLSDHIYKHHNSRTFKCATCDKVFATPMAYYKHVRTHSNVKPFMCSQCGYRALRKDNVKQHVRNVHKLDNPGAYVRRDGDFDHNKDNVYVLGSNRASNSKVEDGMANNNNKPKNLEPSHHVHLTHVANDESGLKGAPVGIVHIIHPIHPPSHEAAVHIHTSEPPSIVQTSQNSSFM